MAELTDAPAAARRRRRRRGSPSSRARARPPRARSCCIRPAIRRSPPRSAASSQITSAANLSRAAHDHGAARRPAARRRARRRAPTRRIVELAALLHSHLIGELTVHPGGDVEAWRTFLLLLGRSPESVRADGGIARVWTTMAGRHVELREIDYAEVLRERTGGESAAWDKVDRELPAGHAPSSSTKTASASCSASPPTRKSSPS